MCGVKQCAFVLYSRCYRAYVGLHEGDRVVYSRLSVFLFDNSCRPSLPLDRPTHNADNTAMHDDGTMISRSTDMHDDRNKFSRGSCAYRTDSHQPTDEDGHSNRTARYTEAHSQTPHLDRDDSAESMDCDDGSFDDKYDTHCNQDSRSAQHSRRSDKVQRRRPCRLQELVGRVASRRVLINI